MPRQVGQQGQGHAETVREHELKICDLCGWLNPETNASCSVCGWHGRFERDPLLVRAAIESVLGESGKLETQCHRDFGVNDEIGTRGVLNRCTKWLRTRLSRMFRRK
jgi:hypothetical protein